MSGYYEPAPAFGSPLRARLLSPNWDLIASHLGRPVPPVLHSLYEPPDGVLRSHCRVFPSDGGKELWLDMFLPMDEMAVAPDGVRLPPGSVAFADDEHGDPYVFVPGESGDGPVYLRRRQNGEASMVPVAPALSTFLRWERRQAG